ncbi:hypothetical protein CASFOL_028870 [Castilleja foliolosa]|uniref:ATP-dependent DNA helicase n=1 Tax=Castilleja foliolosa TaxID=1961234 RepID=A0ABD3CDA5_9LAMI
MDNVRAYNNMFSMTSFGARIDEAVNDGRGPYVFKVSGQISHWIGSICPSANDGPRFLQLYIYDTNNEVPNRLRFFDSSDQRCLLPATVAILSDTLRSSNEYVRIFRTAAEFCNMSAECDFSVRLYNNVGDRRYEPPASGTLGGIVYAEDTNASKYDIVVHKKDGTPHRVSKLHPSYMPLQYPLLFPFAEPGWSTDLRLHSVLGGRPKNLTVNMYYSFQLQDRANMYSLLLNGGRLFQQYLVDAYTCIEQSRLDFINANQNLFRSEYVAGLYDAIARGDNNAQDIGKRVFLPSSFTGGPRYMYKHYQDALAICRVHGNPQYFVTFTCNVKWPEISRHLLKIGGAHSQNRPDIIARVFRIKVQQFLRFIRANRTFGAVAADLYTIEFQKRGLPHCHTLIWVTSPYKVREAADVDRYISAEIPDPVTDPDLHKIVTELMMHGPCGLAKPHSPCMREGICSKSFPKKFESASRFDKDGYVYYKRRDSPHHAMKNGIALDNRSENTLASNSDNTSTVINEVQNFVDGRYICPHEASWRILNFPIHERTPSVELLAVHLENMQNVTFKENLKLQAIVRNPAFGKTKLTEWLQSNKRDSTGLDLTYVTYCSRYRWDKKATAWISRVHLQNPAIGRLAYVHPASDIRTVSNVTHTTYRSACEALRLLGDDREWLTAFVESSSWATSSELRVLFVHMLLFCEDVQESILLELEKLLNSATPSKSLADYGLPLPSPAALASVGNRLLMEEMCYNRAKLAADHQQSFLLLNSDQLQIYNSVLSSYQTGSQVLFFVYGHGGTGKTFLWTTIISYFRSIGRIVLAVAASGIASLLLPSGRTAHSRFKIPIDLTDQSTCHVKKGTHLADLLNQTLLIIWDEAPMSDRRCFECLDKTLRDITGDPIHPFGGKSVLLGGDFRQTLPVKVKCTRSEIIDSTLPRSHLWQHFRLFRLRENMRLRSHKEVSDSADSASEFASWLLSIGDGLLGQPDVNDSQNTRHVEIPPQYLIDTSENSDEINKLVLTLTPGDCKVYSSFDVMIPHGGNHTDLEALYPQEYLNQLSFPGMPLHELNFKINTPIILIRNINQTLGLCNGTRLIVTQLLPRIIEAQIITGTS